MNMLLLVTRSRLNYWSFLSRGAGLQKTSGTFSVLGYSLDNLTILVLIYATRKLCDHI
jgi:hypothetical protein